MFPKFYNYIQYVHPDFLMEMAGISKERKFMFDDEDSDYLRHFVTDDMDDELKKLWLARAIKYRYGPDVLQHPDPEVRDITISSGPKGAVKEKTFKNVNTHSHHLIHKMKYAGFDPNKYSIVADAARRAANYELEHMKDSGKRRAGLAMNKADIENPLAPQVP